MANIGMDQIKELREKTRVGLMDCKNALVEAEGNFDKAIAILRKKGAAVAVKRAGNVTNEGIIAAHISADRQTGSLVEVACETDFAANTDTMKEFVQKIAEQAAEKPVGENVEDFLQQTSIHTSTLTVGEILNDLIAKISENIKVANCARFELKGNSLVQAYIHPGAHLGAMILFSTDKEIREPNKDTLAKLAKDVCMQIAVTNPLCLKSTDLDPETVEKERTHHREQCISSGKPEAIIEKIIDGKMRKYYEEVCLLSQKFIKDDKASIRQCIDAVGKQTGLSITINDFVRFSIGK